MIKSKPKKHKPHLISPFSPVLYTHTSSAISIKQLTPATFHNSTDFGLSMTCKVLCPCVGLSRVASSTGKDQADDSDPLFFFSSLSLFCSAFPLEISFIPQRYPPRHISSNTCTVSRYMLKNSGVRCREQKVARSILIRPGPPLRVRVTAASVGSMKTAVSE